MDRTDIATTATVTPPSCPTLPPRAGDAFCAADLVGWLYRIANRDESLPPAEMMETADDIALPAH